MRVMWSTDGDGPTIGIAGRRSQSVNAAAPSGDQRDFHAVLLEDIDHTIDGVALSDAARVEPGWTENQVAWEIEKYIREHGGEALSFPTIVAGGPHGAMPHARARDVPLRAGEAYAQRIRPGFWSVSVPDSVRSMPMPR